MNNFKIVTLTSDEFEEELEKCTQLELTVDELVKLHSAPTVKFTCIYNNTDVPEHLRAHQYGKLSTLGYVCFGVNCSAAEVETVRPIVEAMSTKLAELDTFECRSAQRLQTDTINRITVEAMSLADYDVEQYYWVALIDGKVVLSLDEPVEAELSVHVRLGWFIVDVDAGNFISNKFVLAVESATISDMPPSLASLVHDSN